MFTRIKYREKVINIFCPKKMWVVRKNYFKLFRNLNIFHVFLDKVLKLALDDQNTSMHVLYKRNSKVELHPSKFFLWMT